MPFRSQAQRRWMHAQKPAMAERWEKETPEGAALPEHVAKKGKIKKAEPAPPKGVSVKEWDRILQRGPGKIKRSEFPNAAGPEDWDSVGVSPWKQDEPRISRDKAAIKKESQGGTVEDIETGDPQRLMPDLQRIHKLGHVKQATGDAMLDPGVMADAQALADIQAMNLPPGFSPTGRISPEMAKMLFVLSNRRRLQQIQQGLLEEELMRHALGKIGHVAPLAKTAEITPEIQQAIQESKQLSAQIQPIYQQAMSLRGLGQRLSGPAASTARPGYGLGRKAGTLLGGAAMGYGLYRLGKHFLGRPKPPPQPQGMPGPMGKMGHVVPVKTAASQADIDEALKRFGNPSTGMGYEDPIWEHMVDPTSARMIATSPHLNEDLHESLSMNADPAVRQALLERPDVSPDIKKAVVNYDRNKQVAKAYHPAWSAAPMLGGAALGGYGGYRLGKLIDIPGPGAVLGGLGGFAAGAALEQPFLARLKRRAEQANPEIPVPEKYLTPGAAKVGHVKSAQGEFEYAETGPNAGQTGYDPPRTWKLPGQLKRAAGLDQEENLDDQERGTDPPAAHPQPVGDRLRTLAQERGPIRKIALASYQGLLDELLKLGEVANNLEHPPKESRGKAVSDLIRRSAPAIGALAGTAWGIHKGRQTGEMAKEVLTGMGTGSLLGSIPEALGSSYDALKRYREVTR